ncbi:polyribonucleotide nucleotidyltransferase 1, mitochondrial-like, partial [Pollicipes pollicipes]|uniref:polyribonucleotide nucleotidyltransferase 1, mitochondrial-like n=1 Tax=Pollicipes pollicipes TaxID=41117 RepID=UPI0018858FEA
SSRLAVSELARFADGSATAQDGDTAVLVTAVSRPRPGPPPGFLPLTVDYRQKAAAAGRIPTNFLRRELGPSEQEILTSRLIDRSLRAQFPAGYGADTQVTCNLLAVDGDRLPDVLCVNAASAALACSDIPWGGPVGAVRMGWLDGQPLVNPGRRELAESSLNLMVTAGPQNTVVMLEAAADNILQQDFMHAIKVGVREAQHVVRGVEQLQRKHGRTKRHFQPPPVDAELDDSVAALCETRLEAILTDCRHDKISRDEAVSAVRADVLEKLRADGGGERAAQASDAFNRLFRALFRRLALDRETRCDGRDADELRPISCRVNLHRPLHGSALFQRGQTQVMCTLTLDSAESVLKSDLMSVITQGVRPKNFMLHYEFPPYATNETGRPGGLGRRELGHGALAERALRAVVPEPFPFALRLTAEVLESNGSSSMASVCAGSLALMDAGVPVSAPVAGVAIGMVSRPDPECPERLGQYRLLTDILGIEDYCGDMDFKLACTPTAITALQADFKLPGLPLSVIMEAVTAGRTATREILGIMAKSLAQPRAERKDNWPVTEEMTVPAHKRGRLLGVGGVNLKRLLANTGVQVTPRDDTTFCVFAPSPAALAEARAHLDALLESSPEPEFEFGAVYTARVVELRETGALVRLHPNAAPALVHNSQLDARPVRHPSALGLSVGDEIQVKYFGRDPVSGHVRLSRKVLLAPAGGPVRNLQPRSDAEQG